MEIELRHLRLVLAIGEAGSVGKAGAALGSTQPAASRQLRRIEQALGGPLFDRSPLGVEPTALGKLVLTRARSVLPAVDSLHTEAACLMAGQRAPEQLRLGARTGPAMMGLVQTVRLVAPQSQVVTESEIRIEGLIDMVSAGRVDAVVINEFVDHDIPTGSEVVRRCLATQPAFVMMSETHELAGKDEVSLADLARERWVLDPLDVDMEHDVFAAACDAEGFVPNVEHYLHGSPNVEFVRRGFLGLCYPMAQFTGIVTKPIAGSPIRFRHVLLVPQTSFLAEHVDLLAEKVLAELDDVSRKSAAYTGWLMRNQADNE